MSKKKKEKFSPILTHEQKTKYREFGQVDETQNWLEIFTEDMISDLFTIMRSCSDNQRKAEYVSKELADYGFYDVGLGTNILTMANPYYTGVVFKIALDDYGIADNFNDCVLSQYVPRYNRVFARDPSAMISVQERLVLPTNDQMNLFMPRILKVLKELSKYFLIADLSPDMFLNYGVTRDGEFRFIDASDLYPLQQMKDTPRCNRITGEHKHTGKFKYCEGKLYYTEDFKYLICEKCGKQFLPLEFRPRKDVEKLSKILSDGYTAEERETMEHEELKAIYQRAGKAVTAPTRTIFVSHEDDDDEEGFDETEYEENASESGGFEEEISEEDGQLEAGEDTEETSEADEAKDPEEDEEDESNVIIVGDDDDDQEADRDQEGFLNLTPRREVILPGMDSSEETEVNPEAAEPVEVDEPVESNDDTNDAPNDQDDQEASDDTVPHEMVETVSKIDKEQAADTASFVMLMKHIKESKDELERHMYQGFLAYVRKAQATAVAEYAAEQIHNGEDEGAAPENPEIISAAEMANRCCEVLAASENPEDTEALKKLVEKYHVENDADNKKILGGSDRYDSTKPHIRYSLIEDDGDEASDQIPGVYLDIRGNFEEAYAESGLPMYITINGGATAYLAVEAYKLYDRIKEMVDEAYAEEAMFARPAKEEHDEEE